MTHRARYFVIAVLCVVLVAGTGAGLTLTVRRAQARAGHTAISSAPLAPCLALAGRPGINGSGYPANNWLQVGFEPGHTRYSPCEFALNQSTVTQLQPAWTFNAGTGNFLRGAPAVVNDIVYTSSDSTTLYALNSATGAVQWTFDSGFGSGTETAPAVAAGVVYTASGNSSEADLFAFNAQTGAPLWTTTLAPGYVTPPVVANGVVYVGSPAALYAVSAATGTILWTSTASHNGFGQPVVGGGIVYAEGDDAANRLMFALDAGSGEVLWTHIVEGYLYGSIAYSSGRLYVAQDYPYAVYALDARTGNTVWTNTDLGSGTETGIAIAYNTLYMNGGGELYALDTTTGTLRFTIASFSDFEAGAPVVANRVLYTIEADTRVHAYNAFNGVPLWSAPLQGEWYSPGAVVASGALYATGLTYLTVFRLPAASSVSQGHSSPR